MTWRKREIEAMKLAHDALGAYMAATDDDEDAKAHSLMAEAFFALKERLAQPEQEPAPWAELIDENQRLRAELKFNTTPPAARSEPVACTACEGDPKAGNIPCCICGATPPQRTWVGLTRDAVEELFWPWSKNTEYKIPLFEFRKLYSIFEAKLKENT